MFKRTVWFTAGLVGGAVTGAGATAYGFVRWREARGALAPDRVADTLVSHGPHGGLVGTPWSSRPAARRANVRDAVTEGRLAMAEAELRIIEELDRRDRRRRSPDGAAGLGH